MALYAANYYPQYGVQRMREQGGERWSELVAYLNTLPAGDERVAALVLTMRRLRRSLRLDTRLCRDAFSAMDASAVLAAFGGSEAELMKLYQRNLADVQRASREMQYRTRYAPAAAVGY